MSWLIEPLGFSFFVRALAAGWLVGAMCGAVGVFVVLRRMSYIGHGLSHSVLGGIAVAIAFDVDAYIGAVTATVLSALLIDRVARQRGLHADAAIGIVTTGLFALGVVVVSSGRAGRVDTEGLLFGSILGVFPADLIVAAGVGLGVLVVLVVGFKRLAFATFDPQVAGVQGVRTGAMDVLFHLLVAAVIVAGVRVLGVLLIAAAVVIPAAVARLVTRSLGPMVLVAVAVSVTATTVGLYVSFWIDIASGATIVLIEALAFAAVALVVAGSAALRRRRSSRDRAEPAGDAVGPPTAPAGAP